MAKRVLLIEDEPNIIEALSFILSRDGWTVHTHSNGETAAQRVRSLPPDVVILDVMLPGRSGFDILREIRADPALKALPVMMLTARGQARDRDLAAQLGADVFLTKPFSNADMLRHMHALVSAVPAGTGAAPGLDPAGTVGADPAGGPEEGPEEGSESGPESGPEGGREGGPESGRESGPESGREGGPESGPETGPEGGLVGGSDADRETGHRETGHRETEHRDAEPATRDAPGPARPR